MNRPKTASYHDGDSFTYTYYDFGALHTVTDQDTNVTTYAYDDLHRPTQIDTPDGYTTYYGYDGVGTRKSLRVQPPGPVNDHEVTYAYDDLNRLTSVTDDGATTTYTYNTVHLMTDVSLPNGVTVEYAFDPVYRVEEIIHKDSGTPFDSYEYTYDAVGNRLEVDEYGGDHYQWIYDDAYRLTDEIYTPNGSSAVPTEFTYDDTGNRETQDVDGTVTYYNYNDLDQLTSTTGAVAATYTYDIRGNLDTVVNTSGTTDYDYNHRNQLASVTRTDSSVVDYEYDHSGNRTSRTIGSSVTKYIWDELSAYGDVILEADETDTTIAEYTLANGQLVSQNRSGTPSYYLYDAQGSVRSLTNSSGTPTDQYDYTAFGELKSYSGSSTPNNYQYTGQQFDDEIDLYSLRARYYDPSNGRFLSKDTWPIDLQNPIELNRYVYTANNPVNFVDPSGYTAVIEYDSNSITSMIASGAVRLLGFVLAPAPANLGLFMMNLLNGAYQGGLGYLLGIAFVNVALKGKQALTKEMFDDLKRINLIRSIVWGAVIGAINTLVVTLQPATGLLKTSFDRLSLFVQSFMLGTTIGPVLYFNFIWSHALGHFPCKPEYPDRCVGDWPPGFAAREVAVIFLSMIGNAAGSNAFVSRFHPLGAFFTVFFNTVATAVGSG